MAVKMVVFVYMVNILQDALVILEELAHFTDSEASYARALAFRRAAATLASLQQPVTRLHDVDDLPSVGEHSKKVIKVRSIF